METSESNVKTTDTDENPLDSRGDTALSRNSNVSGGKGSKKGGDGQEEAEKKGTERKSVNIFRTDQRFRGRLKKRKKKGANSSDGLLPNATPSTPKAPSDNLSDLFGGKGSKKEGDGQISPED